jgi:FecR protein
MTNSLFSTPAAAFLAIALCGAPLLAQDATQAEPPSNAADTASSQPDIAVTTTKPGVRIVRLSQVNGEVRLDRQTGQGFEAAFPNLPIIQGGRLRTGNGVAEVEFEDNSSLRLTPNSLVEFPVLTARPDGTRASTVHVVQGAIYVSLTKNKDSNINVTFANETLALGPSAHIELALNGSQPRLDVLDGTVQAINGATTTSVGKKKALLFDPANSTAPTLLSKNETGPYDAWDKQAVEYHNRLAPSGSNYGSTPYAYGLADMNYYGGFASMGGGCGSMWRPYLVSANWSPYSNGLWAYYPSAGYSWVSPYPWGWTAFHSGSWNLCNGSWGWQPSNGWNGLNNTAAVSGSGWPKHLRPPVHTHPLSPTIVAVNEKPLVISKLNDKDSFVFRKDSAGLGVPRSTFGKLNHISNNVAQRGSIERPVYFPSSPSALQNEHGASTAVGHGTTASHTMPTSSHTTAINMRPSPSSGSGRVGGGQATSTGSFGGSHASSGSMGGGGFGGSHASGGSMGASAGGGSAGGHH